MPFENKNFRNACLPVLHQREPNRIGLFTMSGILLFTLVILFSACKNQPTETKAVKEIKMEDNVDVDSLITSSERIALEIVLPDGEILNSYEGSMEAMLVSFIKDINAKPGKDNWFNFNDLNFEFGTDRILPESMGEVDNIARILKAYPNVKIKIGGYTDKLENEAENLKISTNRAKAVFEYLKKQGVGSQLDGFEGYGSQYAQFAADAAEEDRKKDRRISISIRAK